MGLWSFWLILAVGFLITELLTLSTTCLYIGLGALAAMVCALLGGEWVPTILTFVLATVILYLATYHWRKKLIRYLHKGTSHASTGMEALVGRTGTLFSSSDGLRIRIDGDVWQVRPADRNISLCPGDEVRVVGNDSIILTVEIVTAPNAAVPNSKA